VRSHVVGNRDHVLRARRQNAVQQPARARAQHRPETAAVLGQLVLEQCVRVENHRRQSRRARKMRRQQPFVVMRVDDLERHLAQQSPELEGQQRIEQGELRECRSRRRVHVPARTRDAMHRHGRGRSPIGKMVGHDVDIVPAPS
jgi:hypothetical protein